MQEQNILINGIPIPVTQASEWLFNGQHCEVRLSPLGADRWRVTIERDENSKLFKPERYIVEGLSKLGG